MPLSFREKFFFLIKGAHKSEFMRKAKSRKKRTNKNNNGNELLFLVGHVI